MVNFFFRMDIWTQYSNIKFYHRDSIGVLCNDALEAIEKKKLILPMKRFLDYILRTMINRIRKEEI